MDKYNISIIRLLQQNGRATFAEIGREIGLSAPSVAERIQKMEDEGIIEGYAAKINPEKLGFAINALIELDVSYVQFEKILSNLNEYPEIYEFLKITGKNSVILKAIVKNNSELENLINRLSLLGQPQTSIILSSYIKNPIIIPR